jgi:hypothetical protein
MLVFITFLDSKLLICPYGQILVGFPHCVIF